MKLTRSVGYAVGILLQLPAAPGAGPFTAARISRGCKFPPRFLYRVLRRLVDAGVLRGTSGPKGGYALARPAARISLWEIVQAVEEAGDASPLEAVSPKHKAAIRLINELNDAQAARFRRELGKVSLARLARAGQRRPPASAKGRGGRRG